MVLNYMFVNIQATLLRLNDTVEIDFIMIKWNETDYTSDERNNQIWQLVEMTLL